MAVWDKKIPWGLTLILAGAVGVGVNYPPPVCAIEGSTVTLPCTFTPAQDGRGGLMKVNRVVWCQNHEICHSPTPSVYDSNSASNNPRYKYLGDLKGNCTLQITDVQQRDDATLRFRMETDDSKGVFTGTSGVKVEVYDGTPMDINSSSGDRQMRRGENVTLFCTAPCTFHQLEVTWFRDGRALSESGPALQLSPLTAEDSGNYTCGVKTKPSMISPPYSLRMEAEGAVGVGVNYPPPVCAVEGSTVTLPCTFTPAQDGRGGLMKVIRVVWCQNHEICQGPTPSVYDSNSASNNPRYKYLGDLKGNCTLQITDVQQRDDATLRFRMETDDVKGIFTGRSGVKVKVYDGTPMDINSSSGDRQMRRGENVTLFCTAPCTFHQLEVTWFRDGRALSESGPALQLGPLTAEDSGNYHCGVKTKPSMISLLYSLRMEAEDETEDEGTTGSTVDALLAGRLVLFALHAVLIGILAYTVIKRTCLNGNSRKQKDVTVQPAAFIEEL